MTLLLSVLISWGVLCKEYPFFFDQSAARQHREISTLVDREIERLAANPLVAKSADDTLSALIEAGSPTIKAWVHAHDSPGTSEADIGLAWRKYYVASIFLDKADLTEPLLQLAREAESKVLTRAFSNSFRIKFQSLFVEAKKQSATTVGAFGLTDKATTAIKERIASVRLIWGGATPLESMKWGLAYSPKKHAVHIGARALLYSSDDSKFAAIAHEIAHSFDPNQWRAYFEGPNPFENVTTCLRRPTSIAALPKKDDTQADQIGEAFADWFSAEVLAKSQRGRQGLRSDLCAQDERQPGSSYPANRDRLSRIYFAHPALKPLAGEPISAEYCPPK